MNGICHSHDMHCHSSFSSAHSPQLIVSLLPMATSTSALLLLPQVLCIALVCLVPSFHAHIKHYYLPFPFTCKELHSTLPIGILHGTPLGLGFHFHSHSSDAPHSVLIVQPSFLFHQ